MKAFICITLIWSLIFIMDTIRNPRARLRSSTVLNRVPWHGSIPTLTFWYVKLHILVSIIMAWRHITFPWVRPNFSVYKCASFRARCRQTLCFATLSSHWSIWIRWWWSSQLSIKFLIRQTSFWTMWAPRVRLGCQPILHGVPWHRRVLSFTRVFLSL